MSTDNQDSAAAEYFDGIQKTMMELRLESTSLEAYVSEALSQVKAMRARLAETEQETVLECRRVSEQEKELEKLREALRREEGRRQEVEQKLKRGEEAQSALETEQRRTCRQEQLNKELRSCLDDSQRDMESVKSERVKLREKLDAFRRGATRSVALPAELTSVRNDVVEGGCQRGTNSRRLLQPPGQQEHAVGEKPSFDASAVAELEEERSALEAELEQTRCRTAELANALATERNRFSEAKNAWAKESNLRLRTSPRPIVSATAGKAVIDHVQKNNGKDGRRDSDIVVDCVLAQFAQLRNNSGLRQVSRKCAADG